MAVNQQHDQRPADGRGVLIVGCGFTGCFLAQRLAFRGDPIFGTTRSEERSLVISSRGAEPILMDATDCSAIDRLRGRIYGVVLSMPPQMAKDGSYEDATAGLMDRFANWNLESLVYISSTSVYGCLLYTSPSPRDATLSRMPSSA